ncbi:hypothetical protein EV687_3150 [Corticibacter populi]|nr:hypothetical protein EV687_3150 [Corticibacter populi]
MERSPYFIPYQRDLSPDERAILLCLLKKAAPERLPQTESLKVIGKCGCGGCPTVLFGESFEATPVTKDHYVLADYAGKNSAGGLMGVLVWGNDSGITELECYSIDGSEPVTWPEPQALRPLA